LPKADETRGVKHSDALKLEIISEVPGNRVMVGVLVLCFQGIAEIRAEK